MTEAPFPPDDLLAWLRLTLAPGVSPAMQQALLRTFATPHGVLAARPAALAACCGEAVAAALSRGPDERLLQRTLRWLEIPGHRLLCLGDAEFPQALLTIADPPTVLYAKGRIELLNAPSIAVVGSRNATAQGTSDAESFALALSSAGLCVVSGMALGIDAAAHRGALAESGSSVAVVGTGLDIVYPSSNLDLAHALAANGCLVSEFSLGTRSLAGNFPRRNRLISGLSRGVLVVEAGKPSGSLITARLALEQGRDVFAIPGSIHSPLSKGCHDLLKQGAKLAEEADDILVEIGWESRAPAGSHRTEAPIASPLLDALGHAPAGVDQLARRTGMDSAAIAAQLSLLEIEGRIESLPGGLFRRLEARIGQRRVKGTRSVRIE